MEENYEPPCRLLLREKAVCEACGKRVSLHCLRYRHLCWPAVERVEEYKKRGHAAVHGRAQEYAEEQQRDKYANLLPFVVRW